MIEIILPPPRVHAFVACTHGSKRHWQNALQTAACTHSLALELHLEPLHRFRRPRKELHQRSLHHQDSQAEKCNCHEDFADNNTQADSNPGDRCLLKGVCLPQVPLFEDTVWFRHPA